MKKIQHLDGYTAKEIDKKDAHLEFTDQYPRPPHHKQKYPQRGCITHNFVKNRCTECGGIQASYKPVTGYFDKPKKRCVCTCCDHS